MEAERRMSGLAMVAGGVALGLVGIGGGALLIPALAFFYGMSQIRAQGTSLATLLLPIGFFAFWTYYKAGHVDFRLALWIALGFAAGGWVGGVWAQHLPATVLKRGFAALLVVLAVKMVMEG
ncbi:MAG TPA: sulfite exporter TauE/SafE family protein [Acidobacteriaceae bacterium]|nr:sulfite exporter TauE/SafE family protein [Acidobacteriaceae bacterium]